MVSIFFWAVFGLVIGWIAAILRGEDVLREVFRYVLVGTVGGLVGGFLGVWLTPGEVSYNASSSSLFFAIFGAIASVSFAGLATSNHSGE